MNDITILGAGEAGRALVEEIRKSNNKCGIKIIDKRQYCFPSDDLVSQPGGIKNKINLQNWAKEKKVKFVNEEVERVNVRLKKIFFKGDTQADSFESLVVSSGLVSKKMSLKGEHRGGFFYLSSLEPLIIIDLLKLYREVTVSVSTWLGVKLCLALALLEKEVRIVFTNLDFLGEFKERVINLLDAKENIILHAGSSMEEAVGESTVKAVKISPLKVFSSQLVFVDSGLSPNLKFFEEEVVVNNVFFTNWNDVYLLGAVGNFSANQEMYFFKGLTVAKEQATIFAKHILGQESFSGKNEPWDSSEREKAISSFLKGFEQEENNNDLSSSATVEASG